MNTLRVLKVLLVSVRSTCTLGGFSCPALGGLTPWVLGPGVFQEEQQLPEFGLTFCVANEALGLFWEREQHGTISGVRMLA